MKGAARLFIIISAVMITILLAGVIGDFIQPRTIEVTITPDMIIMPEIPNDKPREYYYHEVELLNGPEYKSFHDSLGIPYITDLDWQETAWALDVPVNELTIEMYKRYLLH